MTLNRFGELIDCTKVIKGPDYMEIHYASGEVRTDLMVEDFSGYHLSGGEYTLPEPDAKDFISGLREGFENE